MLTKICIIIATSIFDTIFGIFLAQRDVIVHIFVCVSSINLRNINYIVTSINLSTHNSFLEKDVNTYARMTIRPV